MEQQTGSSMDENAQAGMKVSNSGKFGIVSIFPAVDLRKVGIAQCLCQSVSRVRQQFPRF